MDSYFSRTNVVAAAATITFLALLGTMFFNRKSRSHQEEKTMASSSFSSSSFPSSSLTLLAPPSSLPHVWVHHVFPSFHGADVRKNFLSHIVKEFKSKGIDLFIDNNIERSKSIGPALIEAIKGSRIAIVFLSKNYASSTWCLNELVEIIKCRKDFGQTVLPIFYQVNPTDIKKQKCYFGKVFRKTCKGKQNEEFQRWKDALTEVAQIEGFHSSNWETEAKMIEAITIDVSNKLNNFAPSSDFNGLIGMESHITEMGPLLQLDSDEVRKIGITGPLGIGKTTIARFLFNQHSQNFQLSIFMENIRRKYPTAAYSDDYRVKLDLQKQFMSQLTNDMDIKIPHLGVVKDRLKDKKVLVVLDDVDQLIQLEAMAKETCWFGPGSRIIITTQNQKILKASGINHIYKVNLPSNDAALQMFCMYAFGQKYPKDGFTELAFEVRSLVGSLPFGLRLMGSYFRGMSEQDWIEVLPRLRTHLDRDGEISSILEFSYDALRDEDKSLFLHIACFFHYGKVDIVEGCLAKYFSDVRHGLNVLAEKSLISMDSGRTTMSNLLIQLGRKYIGEQSDSEPGNRQFLNDAITVDEVLIDDKPDSISVIGRDLNEKISCASERAFNLQNMNYISQRLRVLSWPMFQMTCFPSSFNPSFQVKLDMPFSKLEKLWGETRLQPLNLKWMEELSYSHYLNELPDFSTATNLYELDLTHSSSMVELPSPVSNLGSLSELELKDCSKSEVVPLASINLETLGEANLSDISLLKSHPESSKDVQEIIDPWIERVSGLRKLVQSGVKKLESFPQLPLWKLDGDDGESLERLGSSSSNPDIINLSFLNYFKQNQEEKDIIIQTPSGEVPMCFTYRSSGSSLTVKLNQAPPLGTTTKFKACIVCAGEDENDLREREGASVCCSITTSGGIALGSCLNIIEQLLPGNLYTFEVEVETEEVTSTELVFEFEVDYVDLIKKGKTLEVKECGVLLVNID